MPKKPPRKPANHVDADKIYNQLSADLLSALDAANHDNLEIAQSALKLADTLADPVSKAKAESELGRLTKELTKIDKASRSRTRQLALEYANTKRMLLQERDTKLAQLDKEDRQGRALLRQEYKIKLVELENSREDSVSRVLEDFTQESANLTTKALDVIKDLADQQSSARKDYVDKLDTLLDKVDSAADAQRKEFEETRKRRSKAARDQLKKGKSEDEELQEELDSLSGSFLKRRLFKPLVGKALGLVTEKIQGFKDATGISAIEDLLEAERERKDRIDELNFELATKRTVSEVRKAILEEKSAHEEPGEDTQTEQAHKLSSIVDSLHSLRNTAPALLALASNRVDDDHLLEFSPAQSNRQTPSSVSANQTAAADSVQSRVTDAAESYDAAQDEQLVNREVAALERIAESRKRKYELGLADYLAVGAVVAAGVYKAVDTFFDKTDIAAGVSKALGIVMYPFKSAYDGVSTFITKTIPESLDSLTNMVKGAYDYLVNKGKSAAGVVGRTASAAASYVSPVASAFTFLPGKAMELGSAIGETLSGPTQTSPAKLSAPSASTPSSVAARMSESSANLPPSLSALSDSQSSEVIAKYTSSVAPAASIIQSVANAHQQATGRKATPKDILSVLVSPTKTDEYLGKGFSAKYTKANGQSIAHHVYKLAQSTTSISNLSAGPTADPTSPVFLETSTSVNRIPGLDVSPVSFGKPVSSQVSRQQSNRGKSSVSSTPSLSALNVLNYAITDPNGSAFLLAK